MKAKDFIITNHDKLDNLLVKLCELVIEKQKSDPETHGMVAAAVLDVDNNCVARTSKRRDGKWSHAEREAMTAYENKYGPAKSGSIILTTLTPCSDVMNDRYGSSCTDLINNSDIKKVYCGYRDPSQENEHNEFTEEVTNNEKIQRLCKEFADTFLPKEDINEIEAIPAWGYSGGKETLSDYNNINPSTLKPLPGGSDFAYAIETEGYLTRVLLVDTKKNLTDAIAYLELTKDDSPIKGKPLQVETITVDEDYRGRGLAKALYGIVLTIMKRPLLAGYSQTPGGRRNWMSLVNIPGVEVKGIVPLENRDLEVRNLNYSGTNEKRVEKTIDQVMQLGGQFLGHSKYFTYWAFDVIPGKGQLQPYIKNSLSKIYGYDATNTLLARWVGK